MCSYYTFIPYHCVCVASGGIAILSGVFFPCVFLLHLHFLCCVSIASRGFPIIRGFLFPYMLLLHLHSMAVHVGCIGSPRDPMGSSPPLCVFSTLSFLDIACQLHWQPSRSSKSMLCAFKLFECSIFNVLASPCRPLNLALAILCYGLQDTS